MAFPTTGVLDDFNRANVGPPPSANWTSSVGSGHKVASNVMVGQATGAQRGSYWSAASFGGAQEAYGQVTVKLNNNNDMSFELRISSPGASQSCYRVTMWQRTGNDEFNAYRVVSGTQTGIGSTYVPGVEFAANDWWGARVYAISGGTRIEVYHKPSAGSWGLLTYWDDLSSPINASGGYIGVKNWQSAATSMGLNDFGGGTVVTASAATRHWMLMGVGT